MFFNIVMTISLESQHHFLLGCKLSKYGSVAQGIERVPSKHKVIGSNPIILTIHFRVYKINLESCHGKESG